MIDVAALTATVDRHLAAADAALARDYPGERAGRQPVHTVYVPADRFATGTARTYGRTAAQLVEDHPETFRAVVGTDEDLVARVLAKLADEPVEDLRIDLEDGYGTRPDDEEDAHATAAAEALLAAHAQGVGPPFSGIRCKSLEAPTRARAVRTLARFVATLAAGGGVPPGFVVTLPKVTAVEQVEAMVLLAASLEHQLGLAVGVLRFEIQVETPQSVLGPDGTAPVARMIRAAQGRCTGLHYGTYDYSAACGIAAGDQSLEHPAADHAKAIMQAAAAGTGVRLSDGSTNVLPVGEGLRAGWELHHRLVTRALHRGFYQGWDLHPAQLATRYAATYRFYREAFPSAAERLSAYGSGTSGAIADEPATARALADVVLRGRDCGALSADEVLAAGLDEGALGPLARRPAPGQG